MIVWFNKKEFTGFSNFMSKVYILCTNCHYLIFSLPFMPCWTSDPIFSPLAIYPFFSNVGSDQISSVSLCMCVCVSIYIYMNIYLYLCLIRIHINIHIHIYIYIAYNIQYRLLKLEFHQNRMSATFSSNF